MLVILIIEHGVSADRVEAHPSSQNAERRG